MSFIRGPWRVARALGLAAALAACGDIAATSGGDVIPDPSAIVGASPSPTETPQDQLDSQDNHGSDGGVKNIVQVINKTPGRLRIRGSVQLNRIHGDVVTPLNAAIAIGEDCTGCQTIAVALQLDLYRAGAHTVAPQNFAVAANVRCTKCVTIAHAVQFALAVADPENDASDDQQAKDAKELVKQLQRELDAIAHDQTITAGAAEQRIQAVIAQFNSLASSIRQDVKRAEDEPPPSPTPTTSPAGPTGPTGPTGPSGPTGPTGPTGPSAAPSASQSPSPTP